MSSAILPGFRTLPKELRPRALSLAALRKMRIGPAFGEGAPDVPSTAKQRAHRAARRRHVQIANASRRRNR